MAGVSTRQYSDPDPESNLPHGATLCASIICSGKWDSAQSRESACGSRSSAPHIGQDRLHGRAVGEFDAMSGAIHQQLLRQAAGDLIGVLQDELFEAIDVGELTAAGKFVGGLDRRPLADADRSAMLGGGNLDLLRPLPGTTR